jgi:hypothetical protein
VDGIYIDITRQNWAQDEANDDSFTKKTNISAGFFGFLYCNSQLCLGLDYVY